MISSVLDENGNQEIELIEIYRFVQHYVKQASKMKDLTNDEKHKIVLGSIQKIIPSDVYDRYEPMISVSISFIWGLIKNKGCFKFCK